MLTPLLPIANDWWQHEFNNIEHLACVHEVYGSNHLQKELADGAGQSKNHTGSKAQSQIPFHIQTPEIVKCVPPAISTSKTYAGIYKDKLPIVLIDNLAPPPKFS